MAYPWLKLVFGFPVWLVTYLELIAFPFKFLIPKPWVLLWVFRVLGFRVEGLGFRVGYCPHPVTVYIRGPTKGYI